MTHAVSFDTLKPLQLREKLSEDLCPRRRGRGGFTLIEVIVALVVFSTGVLMVMRLTAALGTQLDHAGQKSEIVLLANERLDSLEATPFDSISPGTLADTVTVLGRSYQRVVTITEVTPVLYQIVVALSPTGATGPSYSALSYTSATW